MSKQALVDEGEGQRIDSIITATNNPRNMNVPYVFGVCADKMLENKDIKTFFVMLGMMVSNGSKVFRMNGCQIHIQANKNTELGKLVEFWVGKPSEMKAVKFVHNKDPADGAYEVLIYDGNSQDFTTEMPWTKKRPSADKLVNTTPHDINLYKDGVLDRTWARSGKELRLSTEQQMDLGKLSGGIPVKTPQRFKDVVWAENGKETTASHLEFSPGHGYLVSMVVAQHLCKYPIRCHFYSPDTNTGAVRDAGRIVGTTCLNLCMPHLMYD